MGQLSYADEAARRILQLRGRRVIIDVDLADLYGVPTKALNQSVKRNAQRFPPDFAFRLTATERDEAVRACPRLKRLKFSPTLPYAYTEHGAVMAANVVRSPRAVRMSIFVVRAFNRLRAALAAHGELTEKLYELERKVAGHDQEIRALVTAMRQMLTAPQEGRRRIGFQP